MSLSRLYRKVKSILDLELPPADSIIAEGRAIAAEIQIGRTAFFDKMGVDSEAQYKRQCVRDGKIMFHAHIGLGSWQATVEALGAIYRSAQEGGFRVDRTGICLDRRMGLPENQRDNAPAETGPLLVTRQDWRQVARSVPIQPHMGDFMIGFPASTKNTVHALRAGVTTIGNLSQYFAHEAPMWRDQVTTTAETVRALAVMGALRDRGALVHSYLEDGFGALFRDCATVAGWAFLERYIVEELLGGKLAHCIGGLTNDPVKRAGWVFAFDKIHDHDSIGSMFYGDTISFTKDLVANNGIVAEYLLWDIMTQLECPTGHAVLPLPVTEAIRIPSAEEIVDAQNFGRRVETAARRLHPFMDFSAPRKFCDEVISAGKTVFNRAMESFQEVGVDTADPVMLLYILKKLGAGDFEAAFGVGEAEEGTGWGRKPLIPSDISELSLKCLADYRPMFTQNRVKEALEGRRMLIASTDVHQHAIWVLHRLLAEAGAEMIYLGAERAADEVASRSASHEVDAILISTHNGMALDYARRLKKELQRLETAIPVIMGGILNQKVEGGVLPIDVDADIKALGFHVSPRLGGTFRRLLENHTETHPGGT